jgi:hypothetical protein
MRVGTHRLWLLQRLPPQLPLLLQQLLRSYCLGTCYRA